MTMQFQIECRVRVLQWHFSRQVTAQLLLSMHVNRDKRALNVYIFVGTNCQKSWVVNCLGPLPGFHCTGTQRNERGCGLSGEIAPQQTVRGSRERPLSLVNTATKIRILGSTVGPISCMPVIMRELALYHPSMCHCYSNVKLHRKAL